MIAFLRRAIAVPLLLAPLPLQAATTGGFSADYVGYSHGLTVLKLTGSLTLTPGGYSAEVTFHTAGLVGMMVHVDNDTHVQGAFDGNKAVPSLFAGTGRMRGTDRATRIEYTGGNPVVKILVPPVEHERSPIAPQDTLHTIDTLSAAALLVREVATTGHCDGSEKTFDGRRLSDLTAHTTGPELLPQTSRSIFSGQTLRCDFDGTQLGGFVNDENEDTLRKPRHGTAWLAPVLPNAPPVPVRVIFDNKILGQVTLYLTAIRATDQPTNSAGK